MRAYRQTDLGEHEVLRNARAIFGQVLCFEHVGDEARDDNEGNHRLRRLGKVHVVCLCPRQRQPAVSELFLQVVSGGGGRRRRSLITWK